MPAQDVKQRTIFLGQSNEEWALTDLSDQFSDEMNDVIDRWQLTGININISRRPVPQPRDSEDEPMVELYAKVTYPPKNISAVGALEMHDVLDKFDQNPPSLPPL